MHNTNNSVDSSLPSASKPRILLVDDDPAVGDGLVRVLRHEAYQLLRAESAEKGLEILRGLQVAVVVSDERMSGMSGSEFLTLVGERYPDTIRIMLTGHGNFDTALRVINDAGIYRFFTKPCNEVELALALRSAIRERALLLYAKRLRDVVDQQSTYIARLEREIPGISQVKRTESGAIILDDCSDIEETLRELKLLQS